MGDDVTSEGDPILIFNPVLPIDFSMQAHAYVFTELILTLHLIAVLWREMSLKASPFGWSFLYNCATFTNCQLVSPDIALEQ